MAHQTLYDRIKEDPERINEIENSFRNKTARGGSFRLHPLHIIEVPDREVLRHNMAQRYGIQNIDDYFIPVIVDTMTYRSLRGIDEPSLFEALSNLSEYHKKYYCLEGHVKKLDGQREGYFISYISVNLPLDIAIEHEAIHAYIFQHNPHYQMYAPRFGFTNIFPLMKPKDKGWIEAISWVATMPEEELDLEQRIKDYVGEIKENKAKAYLSEFHTIALVPVYFTVQFCKKIIQGKTADIPYTAGKTGIQALQIFQSFLHDRRQTANQWRESFMLALSLKHKLGTKRFLELAAVKHEDELRGMAE